MTKVRDSYVQNLNISSQYDQLTQSYVQKPFTIFNLLLSINFEHKEDLPLIPQIVSNTQSELLETQLNIKHLILQQKIRNSDANQDLARYEIEFVDYLNAKPHLKSKVHDLLPSITDLYYIIDHKNDFYPFGVIKAFEILSIILQSNENAKLRQLTIDELLAMMKSTVDGEEIDEVCDSTWKYINAQLKQNHINILNIGSEAIVRIVSYARSMCHSHKLLSLRQTATETISIITKYFTCASIDLDLLIDFVDLLLGLLRDDDLDIRNQVSEIVMKLIDENDEHGTQEYKGKLFLI